MQTRILTGTRFFVLLIAVSCGQSEQTARIIAQDFRFDPMEIRLSSGQPIRLIVVNEGREAHEFKSPLLAHQVGANGRGLSDSLRVLPNQRAETVIRTIPGTYVFYCAIRGHAGMSGTIIVE
jgi:plastocyanin